MPLVAPPSRREWRQFSWVRRAKAIKAAGEPWITENSIVTQVRGIHGAVQIFWMVTFGFMVNAMVRTPGDFKVNATRVAVVAATFVLAWVLFHIIQAHQRRKHREQLQAAYLGAGRCPSCNSGLAPLHDSSNHLFPRSSSSQRGSRAITCAGCGAAWDLTTDDADLCDEPWLAELHD